MSIENKKATLYLGGGGGAEDSARLDTIFFNTLPATGRILYVPLAMDSGNYTGGLEWFTSVVRLYSDTIAIEMLNDQTGKNIILDDYDAVYIGGGNTFKLLDNVLKYGLDKKLITFMKSGKPVYGGSAGAIIMGRSIKTAAAMDERGDYKQEDGLNLLQGACVACHWPETSEHVKKVAKENKFKVYCIPENCGLIFDVDGNLLETVGKEVEIIE